LHYRGHNLAEFGFWRPESFFSLFEVIDKGAPVYVFYNGKKYIYKVKDKTYKDVNDPKLYNITSGERLKLITCVSTWSPTIYTNRRTVFYCLSLTDLIISPSNGNLQFAPTSTLNTIKSTSHFMKVGRGVYQDEGIDKE
jgi:hypothetical protein